MTRPIYWTPARIRQARTAYVAGLSYEEIGLGLEPPRTAQAVRNLLIRQGLVGPSVERRRLVRTVNSWEAAEEAILVEHQDFTDGEIASILNRSGFKRTLTAVQARRKHLGISRPKVEQREHVPAGWPPMHGDPEERDEKFWKAVLMEAVNCGVIQISGGMGPLSRALTRAHSISPKPFPALPKTPPKERGRFAPTVGAGIV